MKISLAELSQTHRLEYIIRTTFHNACPESSSRTLQASYISKHLSANNFKHIIGSNNHKVWVAVENNEVIGLAVIEKQADNIAMLSKLYVLPDFQGQGIALKLYNTAAAYVKKCRYQKLNLSVYSGNLKARSFYEKQGFKLIRECEFIMETEVHLDHIYEISI